MIILILDTETSGLIPGKDKVLEIGAVRYDTEAERIVEVQDFIINHDDLREIPEFITGINGITCDTMYTHGISPKSAISSLLGLFLQSDYICGHNICEFDLPHLIALADSVDQKLPKRPVIDTRTDLPLNYVPKSYSLQNLLLDHEMLNYFPHSAIGDAIMTTKLLTKYWVNDIISRSRVETIKVEAIVSIKNKDLAKNRGFHFKPDTKQWVTSMKRDLYDPSNYNFKTKIL